MLNTINIYLTFSQVISPICFRYSKKSVFNTSTNCGFYNNNNGVTKSAFSGTKKVLSGTKKDLIGTKRYSETSDKLHSSQYQFTKTCICFNQLTKYFSHFYFNQVAKFISDFWFYQITKKIVK